MALVSRRNQLDAMELDEMEVPGSPEGMTPSLTLEDGELGPDPNGPLKMIMPTHQPTPPA